MSITANKTPCFKCKAEDVVAAHWSLFSSPPSVSLGGFAAFPLQVYVCCTCGFAELFVENKDLLVKIRDQAGKETKDHQKPVAKPPGA